MPGKMNISVLLIAAYLPLLPILFLILRSGSFGRGSAGTFLKLFFLGVAAAVPAFLMEAGGMLAVTVLMKVFLSGSREESLYLISAVLRYVLVAAVIEEAWKHFVLRKSTWTQMTMETVADGMAASAAVGAGFSAVMFLAWQVSYWMIPADMASLRAGMPDFLSAGAIISFVYALLFIPAHFGLSGFMGALYGIAKGSDQKSHSGRAGFMLSMSYLLPVLMHGICAGMIGYGLSSGQVLWYILGFVAEGILAMVIAITLSSARAAALAAFAAAEAVNSANAANAANADNTANADGADGAAYASAAENPEAPNTDTTTETGETGFPALEEPGGLYFGTVEDSAGTGADTGSDQDVIDVDASDVQDAQSGLLEMNGTARDYGDSGEKLLPDHEMDNSGGF